MGKWDFDGDEILFFVLAGLVALVGTIRWYWTLVRVSGLGRRTSIRWAMAIVPIAALLPLLFVLARWADPKYVVGQLDYQLLFFVGGVAWISTAASLFPLFGISPRDDALERSNPAALIAICGGILGSMAVYCGSNVGSGPTIWTTIAPALMGTVEWAVAWLAVEFLARPSEPITIHRDVASGLRLAGFLLATGLIIGRSAAGDWSSWHETFSALLMGGLAVIPLVIVALALEFPMRPSIDRPRPPLLRAGIIPTLAFVLAAFGYLWTGGPASIGRHVVTYEEYMQGK